jgi:hypothetical protein
MTPQQQINRAEHAKRLLEDELLNEALDIIEKEVIAQWEAVPVRDMEGREELWKLYKTAKKFRGILHGVVNSGTLSVHALREKQTMPQRIANLVRSNYG